MAVLGARAAREAEQCLELCGIDSREFAILDYLARAEAPIAQATLAFRLARDRSTVMRITRSLSTKGMLVPLRDPRDGRVRAVQITAHGQNAYRLAGDNLLAGAESYFGMLTEEEIDRLLATLARII